jgi:hypothetical protein
LLHRISERRYAGVLFGLGVVLRAVGQHQQSLLSFAQACALEISAVDMSNSMGSLLQVRAMGSSCLYADRVQTADWLFTAFKSTMPNNHRLNSYE